MISFLVGEYAATAPRMAVICLQALVFKSKNYGWISGDKFSFLVNMDAAEQRGRLYGFVMNGDWHHISTPQDLKKVEEFVIV